MPQSRNSCYTLLTVLILFCAQISQSYLSSYKLSSLSRRPDLSCRQSESLQLGAEPSKSAHLTNNCDQLSVIQDLIMHEDEDIIVVYKPPSVLTQTDIKNNTSLLDRINDYISLQVGSNFRQVKVIHRLDRPCSGVIVFAKTSLAAAKLSESFRNRVADKMYACVVNGRVQDQTRSCVHLIEKSGVTEKPVRVCDISEKALKRPNFVEARLDFTVLEYINRSESRSSRDPSTSIEEPAKQTSSGDAVQTQTMLLVLLETGRKHQIRAQLAHIGHPVVGDGKYGAPQTFRERDIALHAYALSIEHPKSREKMIFRAAAPKTWQKRFGMMAVAALNDHIASTTAV